MNVHIRQARHQVDVLSIDDFGILRYSDFISVADFSNSVAFDQDCLIFNDFLFRHGHEVDLFECSDSLVISTAHE
ncbi:MAG: hypothetical protein V2J65_21850 [Desulfobacteraceae bacterium]|nr:hypothetical protein [Desulfobacteraceae bacterium]